MRTTVAASRGSTGVRRPSSYSCATATIFSGSGTGGSGMRTSDFYQDLHLDGGVERQRRDSDRGAGVDAGVAEDLAEQLGGTVGDAGLAGEVGGGGHERD